MTLENSLDWSEIVKKEARGIDESDFGEVQEVGRNFIYTKKGIVSKDRFYIPKYLVRGYDGDKVWFDASEHDLNNWKRDNPPTYEEYTKFKETRADRQVPADIEQRIPLLQEHVQKTATSDDVVLKKEQVTEMKEVPVTHEELKVEKKPGQIVEEK